MSGRRPRCGLLIFLSILLVGITVAARGDDDRSLLLEARARPLTVGVLLPSEAYRPIECTPDAFAAMFLKQQSDEPLAPVFDLLGWKRVEGGDISYEIIEGGGYMGFARDEGEVRRQTFEDVLVGEESWDIEAVVLGRPSYYNYAFVFVSQNGAPWLLMNCLYQFQEPVLKTNSENAWLVGNGEISSTQEGKRVEQWYNLKMDSVDVSYITWASMIAEIRGMDRYDADTLARASYTTYDYTDGQGSAIVDCGLAVVSYQSLTLYRDFYASQGIQSIEQMDALTEVDIYVYNQETHRLEHRANRRFEDASPAFIERSHHFFLDDLIEVQ